MMFLSGQKITDTEGRRFLMEQPICTAALFVVTFDIFTLLWDGKIAVSKQDPARDKGGVSPRG